MSKSIDELVEEDQEAEAEALAFEAAVLQRNDINTERIVESVTAAVAVGSCPFRLVPLNLDGGTFVGDARTANLLAEIGGGAAIHRMTKLFYERAFRDKHFSKFIADFDIPHSERLGNWIIEKMTGEGTPWTTERIERSQCPVQVRLGNGESHVVHDRTSAHKAAWFSPKRHPSEMGDRFKLYDCRVWMRLMFWSGRDLGLFDLSPSFLHWFVGFIKHFIAVYERSAPPFASIEFSWSNSASNIEEYERNELWMTDLLGPMPTSV